MAKDHLESPQHAPGDHPELVEQLRLRLRPP